jgi:hypothetical protein
VGVPFTLLLAGLSIFGITTLSDLPKLVNASKEKAVNQMSEDIKQAQQNLKDRVNQDVAEQEKAAHKNVQDAILKAQKNIEQDLNSMVAAATKEGLRDVNQKVGALESKVSTVEVEARALREQLKTRIPTSRTAKPLTFSDFVALQKHADGLVGEGRLLSPEQRAQLVNMGISSGTVSEGDLVQVSGYLLDAHASRGKIPGISNSDFNLSLAERPDATRFDSIIVKMIPQNRPPEWNLPILSMVAEAKKKVLIRGQLFYENLHRVNNDPNNARMADPKRVSLWEIHPITAFFVCDQTGQDCDPTQPDQWSSVKKAD